MKHNLALSELLYTCSGLFSYTKSKEVTHGEDLEEVDFGEMAFLAFLVRRQQYGHILQVLREQNYEENGSKVAEEDKGRKGTNS